MEFPKGVTRRQIDLLIKITPGPVREGKTITEVAQELGISRQAAHERIRNFKKKFPEFYDNWHSLIRIQKKHRKSLRNPETYEEFKAVEIKEKF